MIMISLHCLASLTFYSQSIQTIGSIFLILRTADTFRSLGEALYIFLICFGLVTLLACFWQIRLPQPRYLQRYVALQIAIALSLQSSFISQGGN